MIVSMNRSNLLLLLFQLYNVTVSVKSSIISSSKNRLPMSLSPIISDLEAEGVSSLSTATFLSSKSVSNSDRKRIFQSLFHSSSSSLDDDGEEDGDVDLHKATSFGKKFDADEDHEAIGIVVANPDVCSSASDSPYEVSSTVLATHGTIIYIVSDVDLIERDGEGLFHSLAPALECLARSNKEESEDATTETGSVTTTSELIVIFLNEDLQSSKEKFQFYVKELLKTIPPSPSSLSSNNLSLEDIFDTIEYLTSNTLESNNDVLMRTLVESKGQLIPSEDALSHVYKSIAMEEYASPGVKKSLSTSNIAALRVLYPLKQQILHMAFTNVQTQTGGNILIGSDEEDDDDEDSPSIQLVPTFGDLLSSALTTSLEQYKQTLSESYPKIISNSPMIQTIQNQIIQEYYNEIEPLYEIQMALLQTSYFELFRKELSKLKLGPLLPSDMEGVVKQCYDEYSTACKRMVPNSTSKVTKPNWKSIASYQSYYSKKLQEYSSERLQAARISGSYRPLPKKGVQVGMHWLLPKPFGNDYRVSSSDIYRGTMVYDGGNKKISEIGEEGVNSAEEGGGDWRNSIVPVPSSTEMMYQPSSGN